MSLELLNEAFCSGESVICAVSGGADSMALLWALFTQRKDLNISAAHFNHRLRGKESERDETFVRAFCQKHGITVHVGSGDVRTYAQEHGKSLEEAARILRYEFLQALDCDKLATAHNADDNAETVLMHLLRGSGLTGLCGIAPTRGRLVRPMLHVTRQEIEAFLRAECIEWVDDSTNCDTAFTRNRVRHEILPLLLRENPKILRSISAQSEILRNENELLDSLAQELLCDAKNDEGYSCQVLSSAPDALQKRALRLMVREFLPQDVSLCHILSMQALLQHPSASASVSLPHGIDAQMFYGNLRICKNDVSFSETPLVFDGETVLPSIGWKITCKITKNLQNFANSPFHFALKYDMIAEHGISVRPRQIGDMLTLSCRKSLKNWFIERKIPAFDRDRIPVFVSNGQVVAVAALGVDRAFCPKEGDNALLIRIINIKEQSLEKSNQSP